MVIAKAQLSGADGVTCRLHLCALGRRAFIGAAKTAKRKVDPLARRLPLDRREALGDHQLMRYAQQGIEKSRTARVGIFLNPQNAREIAAGRPPHLYRIKAEADPRIRDVLPEVLLRRWHQHWAHLAIVQPRQELERLGIDAGLGLVGAEQAYAVRLERSSQRCSRGIELERF